MICKHKVTFNLLDMMSEVSEGTNGLAEANDMDRNLAYMYLMKETAAGKVLFTKEKLEDYGSKVDIFPASKVGLSESEIMERSKV